MNKTLLYFKTWTTTICRNLVGAKVLGLLVMLSVVPYAAFSSNGSLSEVSEATQDGTQTITGVVQDQNGAPLIGVSVAVTGTTTGTATDFEGKFTLKVPAGAELNVTYFGFKPLKVKVGNRTSFTIVMEEDVQKLDDVVVVAYGTQKKESVTAAISTVTNKELRQSSSPNIANALAGRLAGLTSLQSGGAQPGFDDATMYLRGAATVNGTDPLILIDGVPRDNIRTLNVNEVETISVLKDASATAVYGVRGANGVILITTRRGQAGQTEMNVAFDQTWQAYTRQPTRVDAWEFMTMRNEADRNDGTNEEYSGRTIARHLNPLYGLDPNDPQYALKAARRYYMYPNHDWYRETFKKWSSQTNVNVNVTGGTEELKYFVNAGYLHQGGNFHSEPKSFLGYDPQAKNDRFSFRSNIDYQVTKDLSLYVRVGSYVEKVNQPNVGALYGGDRAWMVRDLFHSTLGLRPMTVGPLTPGEELGFNVVPYAIIEPTETGRSPYEFINRRGYWNTVRSNLNSSVGGQWNLDFITKGLSLDGMASFDAVSNTTLEGAISEMLFTATVNEDTDTIYFPCKRETNGTMSLAKSGNTSWSVNLQASLNYNRTFGKHDVGAMLLAQRDLSEVAVASGEGAMPYNVISYAARFRYGFDNRYFAEINMGYNGSEQFAPSTRFGFFPAFSGGWVVTNEEFLKGNKVLTNLKLRASYGKVGSDQLGGSRFLYLDNNTYTAGSGIVTGYGSVTEGRIGNANLHWEISKKQNYGIDVQLFSSWSMTFDYFIEKRSDILKGRGLNPQFAGIISWPTMNLGVTDNRGFEIELNFNKQVTKDLFISAKGNFSYNKNKVIFWDEPMYTEDYVYRYRTTGFALNQQWGYKIDWSNGNGYFNTQEELDRYTEGYVDENGVEHKGISYAIGTAPKLGDFKYIDQNNDGVIDSKDQVPIGYTDQVPRVSYGFQVAANYKWFDLTVFFQGVSKYSDYYTGQGVNENVFQGTFYEWHKHAWTAERYAAGEKITYPRLSTGNTSSKVANDFFIMDRSFMRLKALELGYTLPEKALRAIGIKRMRVYVRGDNIFTWDRLRVDSTDPEATDQIGYPLVKTWNLGFNITF